MFKHKDMPDDMVLMGVNIGTPVAGREQYAYMKLAAVS